MNYKTVIRLLSIFCLLLIGLNACQPSSDRTEQNEETLFQIREEPLTIYIPVHFVYGASEDLPTLYVSQYRLGECWNYTLDSTIYSKAIELFSQETGQAVEIVYFDSQYSLEAQLEQDRQQGSFPDVVLCDASATQAIYAYTQGEYAANLLPYLQAKDNEMYYSTILEVCRYQEEQYILPLLFNLSAVFTEKSIEQNYIGYDDLLVLLEEEMNHLFTTPAVLEAAYAVPTGTPLTIGYILWNAIGQSCYYDQSYSLDEERLEKLFAWMRRYLQIEQEYEGASPEDITIAPYRSWYISDAYLQSFLTAPDPSTATAYYQDFSDCISYFLDGASGCGWPATSMAAQAQYYSSQLESFSLLPISKSNESESYNAAITTFGFVFNQDEGQEAAIQFLLFLQDYKVDPRFGFSVNREVTEYGLNTLTSTNWDLYDKTMNGQIISQLAPLSEALKAQISSSLNCISSASLPNGTLELDIMGNALLQYIETGDWETAWKTLQAQSSTLS